MRIPFDGDAMSFSPEASWGFRVLFAGPVRMDGESSPFQDPLASGGSLTGKGVHVVMVERAAARRGP